jgi:ElaB/YqjD/DUF883 family membrane-anchored ribosome-binding protein
MNENIEQSGGEAAAGEKNFASDIDGLKNSLGQLRTDLNRLLNSALGMGKSSAADAVGGLKDRVNELKDKSADYTEALEQKITDNPLASTLVAIGIGFILAKLITRK